MQCCNLIRRNLNEMSGMFLTVLLGGLFGYKYHHRNAASTDRVQQGLMIAKVFTNY